MMSRVEPIIFLLLALSSFALSLKCYRWTKIMNANGKCVNGTKPGEGESQGEECKGEDYACIKVKRANDEGKVDMGECTPKNGRKMECFKEKNANGTQTICLCDSDLCNTSSRIKTPKFLIASLTLLVAFIQIERSN